MTYLNPDPTPTVDDPSCTVCDGAGWDWQRAADEDLEVDDPVDYYRCRCVETTPPPADPDHDTR